MLYSSWVCRGNLKLITLGSERVSLFGLPHECHPCTQAFAPQGGGGCAGRWFIIRKDSGRYSSAGQTAWSPSCFSARSPQSPSGGILTYYYRGEGCTPIYGLYGDVPLTGYGFCLPECECFCLQWYAFCSFWLWSMVWVKVTVFLPKSCCKRTLLLFQVGSCCMFTPNTPFPIRR